MAKGKEKETKRPLKPVKYKENLKERAAKELTPEMVTQGLRKWLMDDKKIERLCEHAEGSNFASKDKNEEMARWQ